MKKIFKAGFFTMILNSSAFSLEHYVLFSDKTVIGPIPVEDILGKNSSFDDVKNWQQRYHYNKNVKAFLRREDCLIGNYTFDHKGSVCDFHMRCSHGDTQCFLDYICRKKRIYDERYEFIENLIQQNKFQDKVKEQFDLNNTDPNKIQFHETLPVELYIDEENKIYEAHTIADTLFGFPILVWNDKGKICMKPCHWTILPGGNDILNDKHTAYIQGLSGYNLLHYAARYNLISLLEKLFEGYPEDMRQCLNERIPAGQDSGREGDRVPLNFAIAENSVECAKILLSKGAQINEYKQGAPLIFLIQGATGHNHNCIVSYNGETMHCIKQWFDQANNQRRMLQLVCDHKETDFTLAVNKDTEDSFYSKGETILHQYIRSGRNDLFSILVLDYLKKKNSDSEDDNLANRVDLSASNIDTLLQFIQDVYKDQVPEKVSAISDMLNNIKDGVSEKQFFQQFQNRIRFLDEIYARFLISKHKDPEQNFSVKDLFKDLRKGGVPFYRALDVCAKVWAEEHEDMTEEQIKKMLIKFSHYRIIGIGCGTVAATVLGYLAYQRFWKTK